MTTPSINEADERDALDHVTRMLTGTKQLQNEPGVVYSLMQAKAQPQDAQAIDQFLQSLDAEKQVAIARSAGHQIVLSQDQQSMLGANGVPFKDVLYTQQDAAQSVTQRILDASDGKQTAKMNPDGTLALDAHGNIQVTEAASHDSGGGWFSSPSAFLGHVGHAVHVGFSDTLHGLNKAYNFVQAGLSGQYADKVPGHQALDVQDNILHADATRVQDMQDAGYNPNSLWSSLAFGASGKAHSDLSGLNDKYGQQNVDQALRFLSDPKGYRKGILDDPNNYIQDATGQAALTQDAETKLRYLASSDFETLARQVSAKQNTLGHDFAAAVGLDPVHHATTFNLLAAGTDLAAAFAVDPMVIAGKAAQIAKAGSVGLDTLGDAEQAASILTRNSASPWVRNVQRGWKRGIDLGGEFRQAVEAGDTAKAAAVTSQFRAELPALEPIMDKFTGGTHTFQGFEGEGLVNGKLMPKASFGADGGFQTLDDAAMWLRSQQGMTRLFYGRASTQASLMPGALSAFGYRKLKGLTAGWMTERSASRANAAYGSVISRAQADPMLAKSLIDDGMLRRLQAEADDAVDGATGSVISQPAEDAALELTDAGKGQIAQNLRTRGDALGESSRFGYFSGTAIAARFRLAAQRFSTLLPRNTLIDLNAANSGDILYKTAMTYLNRGDANTLRAMWNVASAGERKRIVHGLIDQLSHSAGLTKTESGRQIVSKLHTDEAYMASGADNEIVLNGDKIAPFEGQTRTTWLLPSFQQMHKAANQITLGEHTFGRPFSSNLADTIMGQWKLAALFKPSTVTRNQLEGWLRTILDGRAGDALKARALATARNKELWKRGFGQDDLEAFVKVRGEAAGLRKLLKTGGLSQAQRADTSARLRDAERRVAQLNLKPIIQHRLAKEAGNADLAKQIENGSMLSGEVLGRSTASDWLANTAPLAIVGRAYRSLVGRHMGAEDIDALLTMEPHELQLAMEGYGQQILESDLGFTNASRDATEIAQAGYGPALIKWAVHRAQERGKAGAEKVSKHTSWTHQALDGTLGAERYATALAQRVNDMPETARAALMHLTDPGGHTLDGVVGALEAESKNTAFGHVFFENPINASHVARKAVSDAERKAGKYEWANKVVHEYKYLLTGQNGELQHDIAERILSTGKAPDGDWISHIKGDNRPESALAPQNMVMSPGGIQSIAQRLQDIEGGAYQWMVERTLQRTTSSPVFLANYAIARRGLNKQVDQMVTEGFSREAAENLAKDLSTRQSWIKTEQLIDDPGQKTQFDVIARNMIPFARATQAMIRRWGTGLWQNPVAARKMMLSYEGAVHSGLIYTNQYGEPTFTYPASGVMNMALRGLSEVPGFRGVGQFPVASDLTGGVLMSVPGADNPFRMSMGPMASIPLREVYKHLLPAAYRGEAFKLDEFFNGPIGAGQTWVQLVPNSVRRYYQQFSPDDRNSALASSMNGAIANLAAGGYVPAPDASPSERQQFATRLQAQVKNQLFLRATFALFAPAAPSTPTEATDGSHADYAWQVDGIKGLSDEYKSILNEVGGDIGRASAVFTALHPDEVVYDSKGDLTEFKIPASAYETSRSGANAPGAYLPSTDKALGWLDTHAGFIGKYKSVAAYFLPEGTAGGQFSDAAYKAQIEFGLRIRKTPDEFTNDIYVRHAESVFYPVSQEFQNRIAAAKAQGDDGLVSQLTAQRSAWEHDFKDLNPLFGHKIDDYGQARSVATDALLDLRRMTQQGDAPDGLGSQLHQLITSYDGYESFIRDHAGQDDANTTARANALEMFNRWADHSLTGTPLVSVFNGVFRVLNTNFDRIGGLVK